MSFECPKIETGIKPETEIESNYRDFVPKEFKGDPFGYFERLGKNIKSGEIKTDEQGRVLEDPTAVKELPVWQNPQGKEISVIAKRVNREKGEVARSQNPLHECEVMRKVKELGLPVADTIGWIREGDSYLILTERIPGTLWRDKDALKLREKGYSKEDIEQLKQQAQQQMEELAEEFKKKGIIRSWKLKDMVFDLDIEGKKIKKITPTDWERTSIDMPLGPEKIPTFSQGTPEDAEKRMAGKMAGKRGKGFGEIVTEPEPLEEKRKKQEEEEFRGAQERIGVIFDKHEDGKKRVEDIISILGPFLGSNLIDGKEIRRSLEECSTIQEREMFVGAIMSSLAPLIELKRNNPRTYEEIEAEVFVKQGGFIKLNRMLSYGYSGEEDEFIHIHLAPSRTLGPKEKITFTIDGFNKLAKTVKENEKIKGITASSNIVAEHPETMERLGFIVLGEIDEKTKQAHFADGDREIHIAAMSREALLSKYLKEDKE